MITSEHTPPQERNLLTGRQRGDLSNETLSKLNPCTRLVFNENFCKELYTCAIKVTGKKFSGHGSHVAGCQVKEILNPIRNELENTYQDLKELDNKGLLKLIIYVAINPDQYKGNNSYNLDWNLSHYSYTNTDKKILSGPLITEAITNNLLSNNVTNMDKFYEMFNKLDKKLEMYNYFLPTEKVKKLLLPKMVKKLTKEHDNITKEIKNIMCQQLKDGDIGKIFTLYKNEDGSIANMLLRRIISEHEFRQLLYSDEVMSSLKTFGGTYIKELAKSGSLYKEKIQEMNNLLTKIWDVNIGSGTFCGDESHKAFKEVLAYKLSEEGSRYSRDFKYRMEDKAVMGVMEAINFKPINWKYTGEIQKLIDELYNIENSDTWCYKWLLRELGVISPIER